MRRLLSVPIILCTLPSCISFIAHDEQLAAKTATQFAQAAFVDRDNARAYGLITPEFAKAFSREKLAEEIAKAHPKTYPTRVAATEFEPISGQKRMWIYVKGTGEGEEFYYRLAMDGDAKAGYKVGGLFRSSGPYPPSRRMTLK
ncbi:hypothetical protein [Singulisphaera sp. PoT]|uniref:hypothetical protein n=1 Tax=Singulisphaera sp. PoT TaxID=3411797 RepID=UPI003BF56C3B